MSQMGLNLDLSPQLVLNMRLQQLFLVEDFEGNYELGLFLPGQVHMSKLASTQGFTDLEIIDSPLLALKFLIVRLHRFVHMSVLFVSLRSHHPWHRQVLLFLLEVE